MTYTIKIELHEAILDDDKSIAELVRKKVAKSKSFNFNPFHFETDENGHITY